MKTAVVLISYIFFFFFIHLWNAYVKYQYFVYIGIYETSSNKTIKEKYYKQNGYNCFKITNITNRYTDTHIIFTQLKEQHPHLLLSYANQFYWISMLPFYNWILFNCILWIRCTEYVPTWIYHSFGKLTIKCMFLISILKGDSR